MRRHGRRYRTIEIIVDTGFDGWLSLPPKLIIDLDLPLIGDGEGEMADGSRSRFDIHEATIRWHGRPCLVPVYALGAIPLMGMSLLTGSELNIKVRQGGPLTIKPLRRRQY
jgi:clan AA aspartic protease